VSHWLGIDLGGTNIKFVTIAENGSYLEVIARDSTPTKAQQGPARVVDTLARIAERAVSLDPKIQGVGVTVPGLFDSLLGVTTLIPNLTGDWRGQSIVEPISRMCSRPVSIINDARAFGLGELWLGAARGHNSMAGITIGTGLGGVIVLNGGLHLSASGSAGEIGHQTIIPNGLLCGCGNRGCLETLASGSAIARLSGKDCAEEVFESAQGGNPLCQQVLNEAISAIAIGLANIATVLTPEVFVIGGGVSVRADQFLEPIQRELYERAPLVDRAFLEVRPAELGTSAGAVGAALWARE